jgi:hypothetical protein
MAIWLPDGYMVRWLNGDMVAKNLELETQAGWLYGFMAEWLEL